MNIVPEMSDRVREAPHATTTDRRRKAVINLLNEKAANTCEYLDLLIESDMRHTAPRTLPEAITPAPAPTEEPKEAPETTGTRDSEIPVITPKIRVSRDPRLRNKTEQARGADTNRRKGTDTTPTPGAEPTRKVASKAYNQWGEDQQNRSIMEKTLDSVVLAESQSATGTQGTKDTFHLLECKLCGKKILGKGSRRHQGRKTVARHMIEAHWTARDSQQLQET